MIKLFEKAVQNIDGLMNMHLVDTRGGRIELARRAKGLAPGEFRRLLKEEKGIEIGASHWGRVESDRVGISVPLLEAVCELLEESADWILFGKQPNAAAGDHGVGVSEEAAEIAQIVDALDTDLRNRILDYARWLGEINTERRTAAQREAALHTTIISLTSADNRRSGVTGHRRKPEDAE